MFLNKNRQAYIVLITNLPDEAQVYNILTIYSFIATYGLIEALSGRRSLVPASPLAPGDPDDGRAKVDGPSGVWLV